MAALAIAAAALAPGAAQSIIELTLAAAFLSWLGLRLIGALIGEWFGAPRGLGILIINAMQNFQIPLLWSVVVLVAATSLILFAAMTFLERIVHERYR